MSVARGQSIEIGDLDVLASLAIVKLSSSFSFTPFAGTDQITLPLDIAPVPTYGTGAWPDSSKITLRLYAYRTIDGVKTYSWEPVLKALTGKTGSGNFSMTWTWTNPTGPKAPEGYVVTIAPSTTFGGTAFAWRDIGSVNTFTEDGSFSNPAWKFDGSLKDNAANNVPCGHGIWLKQLNQIRKAALAQLDIFGGAVPFGDTHKVSGPWCVSVAPRCSLYLNGKTAYKNLKFIYSDADSLTGNSLASEADMLDTFIGINNGTNNFNWGVNVKINGRIVFFSEPQGQSPSDWSLSASHPGITITFDPNYLEDRRSPSLGAVTAFIFDFKDVMYVVGTPVVLIATPLSGGTVYQAGVVGGGGASVDCVFTGNTTAYPSTDTIAIHYAGPTAKSVALANTLTNISFTSPTGGVASLESHWRCFCNGVFIANTLPTMGVMPYIDVDLPQYSAGSVFANGSSRRAPMNDSLLYIASVDNRGALYPVLRDIDFTPDSVVGQPFLGSAAWQGLGTPLVFPNSTNDTIDAFGSLNVQAVFVPAGAVDVRFLAADPNAVLYVRANDFPTTSVFDASAAGGNWLSLATSLPGFETDTTWFCMVANPTGNPITTVTRTVVIQSGTAPNGTLFATGLDDTGNRYGLKEGYSYHFPDGSLFTDSSPIPLLGYCVYSICFRRLPVDNGSGVALAPTDGTADLEVKLGLMEGFGYEAPGTFVQIQSLTIPAGQASVTVDGFLPVLAGAPLAYQSSETIVARASVNFQPMMHSSFNPTTTLVDGRSVTVGYYNGTPWFDNDEALLFFVSGDPLKPIVLPLGADIYNDLIDFLNTL